jgi:hypothetical protein
MIRREARPVALLFFSSHLFDDCEEFFCPPNISYRALLLLLLL